MKNTTTSIKNTILLLSILFSFQNLLGQEKPKATFRARLLSDYTASSYLGGETKAYYRIEDLRLGVKVSKDAYTFLLDFGYGESKLSLKDMFLSYQHGKSRWTIGNVYEPFSMDILISTLDLFFHQSASSVQAIANGRRVGVTYHYNGTHSYWGIGAYLDSDINQWNSNLKQAFATTTRYIYRSHPESNTLLHLGGAISLRTSDRNKENKSYKQLTHTAVGISSMLNGSIITTTIENVNHQIKTNLEFMLQGQRVRILGEYLHSIAARENRSHYHARGAYIQGGLLLKGEGFNYDRSLSVVSSPEPRSLELVGRYNFLHLDKTQTQSHDSSIQDISLGLNYYINPYIAIKLNGSYAYNIVNNLTSPGTDAFFLAQLRLQCSI